MPGHRALGQILHPAWILLGGALLAIFSAYRFAIGFFVNYDFYQFVIHILDTRHLGFQGIVAVTALETEDGVVLFDTGPESTFENVMAELRAVELRLGDV